MACYNPVPAWQPDEGGQIVFNQVKNAREIKVPCNNCIGCRIDRSRSWALRIMHEAQQYEENNFITLTYNAENIPRDGGLVKAHFRNFMKRLRKKISPRKVKFYMCGEYGDKNNRPHYHAVIFNYAFTDWEYLRDSDSGYPIYTSNELEKLWGKGFVQVGELTPESAAYISRYVLKKIVGNATDVIDENTGLKPYERVHTDTGQIIEVWPEYSTMSRGGRSGRGIANDWIHNYKTDVYPKDYTTLNDRKYKPPRYYDERLKEIDIDMYDDIKEGRKQLIAKLSGDNTTERLKQRAKVAVAKSNLLKRNL
jgi:hypothetical protein